VVDYVRYWTDRAETPTKTILAWLAPVDCRGATSKFHTWKDGMARSMNTMARSPGIIGSKRGSGLPFLSFTTGIPWKDTVG
jgi:hypothetical protein